MEQVKLIHLPKIEDQRGNLSFVEVANFIGGEEYKAISRDS